MNPSRRHFLFVAGAFAAGFGGLRRLMAAEGSLGSTWLDDAEQSRAGYGPLLDGEHFDLPRGFRATVISRTGEKMDDGFLLPGLPDGMAAFPGPEGRALVVRNHELQPDHARIGPFGRDNALLERLPADRIYDRGHGISPAQGGTTTFVFNTRTQKIERQFLSLAGTLRNCAGGPTPWGSWLSCEEDVSKAAQPGSPPGGLERHHGYVFEVPATYEPALAAPIPITGMGRFYHEAVAVDPRTGVVYLTEDRPDGLLYRYIPDTPGRLHEGGKLQALMVVGEASLDTRNWGGGRTIRVGEPLTVGWITLEDIDSPQDDLRHRGFEQGAARFARAEGMWHGNDSVYFCCTNGGRAKRGQVWRLTPGGGGDGDAADRLELFAEPNDSSIMNMCDNVTVAPWGDLIICEDGTSVNRILGVTPRGEVYTLARMKSGNSELAGATFTPDGTTLLVNMQQAGLTLAITGPWKRA